jgi:hypothetical protein
MMIGRSWRRFEALEQRLEKDGTRQRQIPTGQMGGTEDPNGYWQRNTALAGRLSVENKR